MLDIRSPSVDLDHPSPARIYDYLLGGTSNWAVDRDFSDRAVRQFPLLRSIALANRQFLNRVVRRLTRFGIRQFLDIGPVVPQAGSTHRIANDIAPGTRVVYADHEPMSIAYAEVQLDRDGDPDRHAVINANLHDPDELWTEAVATGVFDPRKPVALLMIGVLQELRGPDGADTSAQTVARYHELLPHGSYLAISHMTYDGVPPEFVPMLAGFKEMCEEAINPIKCRQRYEIEKLFGDFEVIKPGMVWIPEWHPEECPGGRRITFARPNYSTMWAGVGHKIWAS